jgi:competence protein ComEC
MESIITWSSGMSWAILETGPLSAMMVALFIFFLASMSGSMPQWKVFRRPRLVVGLALAAIASWGWVLEGAGAGILSARFLALGEGDATLIEMPFGGTVLVDGGPGIAKSQLLNVLHDLGRERIDLVVLTHPDADHIGGLPDVIDTLEIGAVVTSGRESDTGTFSRFKQAVRNKGIPHFIVDTGDRIAGFDGVELMVLGPSHSMLSGPTNRSSVVLRVDYNDIEILLTGDIDKIAEREVLRNAAVLEAEILKVSHHGSKTSSCSEFLRQAQPEVAVIMVGKNQYGHPARDVMERLWLQCGTVFRTDWSGTVTVRTDGERYWVEAPRMLATYMGGKDDSELKNKKQAGD